MFLRQALLRDTGSLDGHGRVLWQLEEDLIYVETFDGGELRVHVPKKFITNLASTPWFVWWIFPPSGPWNACAIAHDFLCTLGISRFLADAMLRHFMKRRRVPMWRRVVVYYAVRFASLLTGKG